MEKVEIQFGALCFVLAGDAITLNGFPFVEIQLAGRNRDNHLGAKHVCLSERSLRYVSHESTGDVLRIVQANDLIRAVSVFTSYEDTSAISVFTEIENISPQDLVVESISSFVYPNLAGQDVSPKDIYLYRFVQSHHGECRVRKNSLFDLGLERVNKAGQFRVSHANVGSWSTKEELPQGITECGGKFVMFQIESSNSWYYELSDEEQAFYLYLGGANEDFCGWTKKLAHGQTYRTVPSAVCFADDLEAVIAEMTRYRRHIAGKSQADETLPAVFNEYMHLSWDSPSEDRTKKIAASIARTGVDYYVIDCGWHDEVPGTEVYPYVGRWRESRVRFPNGLRKTTDYIRSLGMKAGLWIEPEVVGYKCSEMLGYYGDACFLHRRGQKICVMGRYFLDYRVQKVRDCMTETIRRMVEDYGADYIKFDYNQDIGIGTDSASDSSGDGLEQSAGAFFAWVDGIRNLFPQVLFEACASGGMRMDYETLKHFSIVSTSDQTDYLKYPCIAGNILSAVLPEQAAVWSYPVADMPAIGDERLAAEWVEKNISEEQVVINMVNALLGRIHLASDLSLLSEKKFSLVREGIDYYKKTAAAKKVSVPLFPNGFASFGDSHVAAGYRSGDSIYLAVWNLGGYLTMRLCLEQKMKKISVGYPVCSPVTAEIDGDFVNIQFTENIQACFLEIQ